MTEEGTLELRIDRFSEFAANESQLFSAPTYIHGFVWRIVVKPSWRSDVRLVFLQCTGGDNVTNWSCKASATLHIVSQKVGVDDLEIVEKGLSLSMESDFELLSKISCSGVISDSDLIKDNTVILRVHVKAEVPPGVRIAKIASLKKFASSISDPPDGVLIVGTNRIPIHKTYLSYYSDYFKTMFRSEFKEGREDEIVIEDVEYEEMIELLAVIYPSIAPVTARNLKTILKLADRFIMPVVVERCKKELRISTINGAQKLLLAQIYNFEDLQMEFAQQYKSAEDAKKLKSEPEYSQLDNKTLLMVFDNLLFWIFGDGKEHAWALDVLKDGFSAAGNRLAFLDLLLEMERNGQLSEKEIQEEVDTFMFEGHDTTATAVTWMLHLLGCYPDIQEKVFDELQKICGDSTDVSMDQLGQMKYLECCVKEALRLYPSVPIIARRLGSDASIGGHLIPEGTQVLINIFLIHRDPAYWKDPEVFNPDSNLVELRNGCSILFDLLKFRGEHNRLPKPGDSHHLILAFTLLRILQAAQVESGKVAVTNANVHAKPLVLVLHHYPHSGIYGNNVATSDHRRRIIFMVCLSSVIIFLAFAFIISLLELPLDLDKVKNCTSYPCVVIKFKGLHVYYSKIVIGTLNVIFGIGFFIALKRRNSKQIKNRIVTVTILAEIFFNVLPGYCSSLFNSISGDNIANYLGQFVGTFLTCDALFCSIIYSMIFLRRTGNTTAVSKISTRPSAASSR
ncbi:cytochrome p450 domain-containing protein [Ditylenchus destructor]|nr:cytochrome p450 domain-containing protein [Ditylenchus destructor]